MAARAEGRARKPQIERLVTAGRPKRSNSVRYPKIRSRCRRRKLSRGPLTHLPSSLRSPGWRMCRLQRNAVPATSVITANLACDSVGSAPDVQASHRLYGSWLAAAGGEGVRLGTKAIWQRFGAMRAGFSNRRLRSTRGMHTHIRPPIGAENREIGSGGVFPACSMKSRSLRRYKRTA